MIDMTALTREAVAAKPVFEMVNPNYKYLFKGKVFQWVSRLSVVKQAAEETMEFVTGHKTADEALGDFLGRRIVKKSLSPLRSRILRTHKRMRYVRGKDLWRKNGLGGRTWPRGPERLPLIIIFHDANRAGPHIDVHIGRFSLVRRVKPEIHEKLRYNSEGRLTEASRRILMDFLKDEIDSRARIPQNLDHTLSNARMEWVDGDTESKAYGSGKTRQIVREGEALVYKAYPDGEHFEFYAPLLNPDRGMYVHRLYEGSDTRAPIAVWGNLDPNIPPLEERLHLKNYHPEDFEEMEAKSDMETSTGKYDGSSVYVVTNNKGTHLWSPRESVVTGKRIEYTFMVPEIAMHSTDEQTIAMGEMVFRRDGWLEAFLPNFLLPDRYLPQAEGSGILNAHALRPHDVVPEIRLYRVDKVGRRKTKDLPFWDNRDLQEEFARTHPTLHVVKLLTPAQAKLKGFEGIVTAPPERSINEGYKLKWWRDPDDWRITAIDLYDGPKGGIAGVVRFRSLESGNTFKLGPGQMGDHAFNKELMENPDAYIGRTAKVKSKMGHEGRASSFIGLHDDK